MIFNNISEKDLKVFYRYVGILIDAGFPFNKNMDEVYILASEHGICKDDATRIVQLCMEGE